MNTHADRSLENKSQSVANEVSKKQSGGESTFQFVDKRPEAIAQRQLQEMANNSSHVRQLRAYQEMAANSSEAMKFKTVNNNPQSKEITIQRKISLKWGDSESEVELNTLKNWLDKGGINYDKLSPDKQSVITKMISDDNSRVFNWNYGQKDLLNMLSSLIVGESHSDPSARNFIKGEIPYLASQGYKYLAIETDGTAIIGSFFDKSLPNNSTLQKAFDNIFINQDDESLANIRDQSGKLYFGHQANDLGGLLVEAIKNGIQIKCVDYDPQERVPYDQRVPVFDSFASNKLMALDDKWIALVGADHIPGIEDITGAKSVDKSS